MQIKYLRRCILVAFAIVSYSSLLYAGNTQKTIMEENVTYKSGDVILKGFIAYDAAIKGKRPVILVVHEWWGQNDYTRMRARKLAELGYFAMAVDMFGDGKIAANPQEAQEYTKPFYGDPQLSKTRLEAAMNKVKDFPQADADNIAAIGYCFGGSVVLNSAKLGADLKGVVSFHGGLGGAPVDKKLLKAKILICHGGSDKFVPQADIDAIKHRLDSIGAAYTFKVYANATHAFTNPEATTIGKKFNMPIEYNADADKDSWADMKLFLKSLFPVKK
ncbi:MAG: dienelactone hydrolase family protein [Bacteroidota bacterium]